MYFFLCGYCGFQPGDSVIYNISWSHTDTIVTDKIGCTVSFWWRGQGRHSWCVHPRNAQTLSSNLDINVSGRFYRHKHRTTPIQWACLVRVQGLWCHVFIVCVWELLVYRGMDSLSKEEETRSEVSCETRPHTHKPGTEGEFGWHTRWSITVGHRAGHRWTRWWARRGTRSLSVDCCYSNQLDLLRVETRVCSYNLCATPFLRFPSHLALVKFIKLKRTQSVCTRVKEREKERKNREKIKFLLLFFEKKMNFRQKIIIKK